jgi:hypothetical protein
MTMSEPGSSAPRQDDDAPIEADDDLQFDHAEYTTPAPSGPSCGVCQRSIADVYYEMGGKVVCAACRQGIEAAFRGGSHLARVVKALFLGSVAAVLGAVIYYAILRATGYNLGLVAVVVGAMVGGAVRKGTGNRGGVFYQLLAVFLTYSAIAGMHIPFVYEGINQARQEGQQPRFGAEQVEKASAKAKAPPLAPAIVANDPARPLPDIPPNPFADAKAEHPRVRVASVEDRDANNVKPVPEQKRRAFNSPLFLIVIVIVLFASPVIHAFQAPISGLIFGFALWEAWKMNKGVRLSFSGPFRVTSKGSDEQASEVGDDGG